MFTNTKIALAAALILGTASAAHAQQNVVKSYDGIVVRPSTSVNPNPSTKPTGAVRPLTPFERNWFDYQNHE